MKTDKFGQLIFDEKDLLEIYYKDPEKVLHDVLLDVELKFDLSLELSNLPKIKKYVDPIVDISEFDTQNQNNWFMPEAYKTLDIAQYVLDKCESDAELQRAGHELLLFQERNMFDLLRYLTYLVDTMRQNNIVWGVGRGSSVSSFVLYLLGVHKINSLYYDLNIDEFLK